MLETLGYAEALAKQAKRDVKRTPAWLLFTPPPTFTFTRRSAEEEFLVPQSHLEANGAQVLRVNRGGRTTYHGPGQIVGFPMGRLEDFVGDPRGVRAFISKTLGALQEFVAEELARAKDRRRVDARKSLECAGVWLDGADDHRARKIVSIGMSFHRAGIAHGFSLNVSSQVRPYFSRIRACGDEGAEQAWLHDAASAETSLRIAERLSRALAALQTPG